MHNCMHLFMCIYLVRKGVKKCSDFLRIIDKTDRQTHIVESSDLLHCCLTIKRLYLINTIFLKDHIQSTLLMHAS